MEKIVKFAEIISEDLGMDLPKIIVDKSHFPTDTTLALAEIQGETIYISNTEISLDLYFAIAHEMRHIWQNRKSPGRYFSGYKTSDLLDIDAYNRQPAEIDANAYATVVMIDIFGVEPRFDGFNDETKEMIWDYIDENF